MLIRGRAPLSIRPASTDPRSSVLVACLPRFAPLSTHDGSAIPSCPGSKTSVGTASGSVKKQPKYRTVTSCKANRSLDHEPR
jgi:hypothetical protein